MLIDHPEFQVIKVHNTEFQHAADARKKGDPHFVEFEQRNSYFVLPMIEKLKKDKLLLRRQMNINNPG